MKRHLYKIAITGLILLMGTVSCKEGFLDTTNRNAITSNSFWRNKEDVQKAVNTLYPTFNSITNGAAYALNLRSDGVSLAASDFAQFKEYTTFTNLPENGLSDFFWYDSYNLIYKANTILQAVEEKPRHFWEKYTFSELII